MATTGSRRLRNDGDDSEDVLAESGILKHFQSDGFFDEDGVCIAMHEIFWVDQVSRGSAGPEGNIDAMTPTEAKTIK
jgi:hypothetical protein